MFMFMVVVVVVVVRLGLRRVLSNERSRLCGFSEECLRLLRFVIMLVIVGLALGV
jgi:hypothetical protein